MPYCIRKLDVHGIEVVTFGLETLFIFEEVSDFYYTSQSGP